jgi:L-cysteine:1D-myo-inositol 2-amino-2-deoxy-alpha-D-glucopyranoside ligase
VATGEPFAQAYVHAGMVGLAGEKMSKSKGNLELVSRLRDTGHDPMAIRLALLAHHYRADWEWTDAELTTAEQRLETWRTAVQRPSTPPADELIAALRATLADDLDAPAALAAIDSWATAEGKDQGAAEVANAIDALLGVHL